jgi:ADP-heptose:LPS heptosyltransferase
MTHRRRILADRLIAAPTAIVFNGLARLLAPLMRRDHSVNSGNVNRIIVAKLVGMGSILQATPLLKALKHRYPGCKLTFVTLRSNQEMVTRLPVVDEVLSIDDRSGFAMATTTLSTIAELIRRRADLYFDLEVYSGFASLLTLWAVTRNRLGFYRHGVAFKNGIYTHLVYFNTRMPIRLLYLQLGRVAGVTPGEPEPIGPLRVDDSDRAAMRAVMGRITGWRADEPYIVVNPNASDLLLERRWPPAYVVEAVTQLVALKYQVVLIGARDELPYVQSLVDRMTPEVQAQVVNTAGCLSLGALFALLEGAACVLTNDTGPMHMAIALKRPTVCLFGPASPEHYGHAADNVESIYAPVFCSPCVHEIEPPPCKGNNICMQRIQPELAIQAVRRLMSGGASSTAGESRGGLRSLPFASDGPDQSPLGVVVRASIKLNEPPRS